MPEPKEFSIAVNGSGRLLDMFITDGMKRFPKAIWYDRTSGTRAAIGREIELGKAGLLRAKDKKMTKRAERNLIVPPSADVTVTFKKVGNIEYVMVKGTSRQQRLSLDLDATVAPSLSALEKYVQRIISSVAVVL